MPRRPTADTWRSPEGAVATVVRTTTEWVVEFEAGTRTERIVFGLDAHRVRPRVCFGAVLRPMDISATPSGVTALVAAVDPTGHLAAGLATRLAELVPSVPVTAALTAVVGAGAFPQLAPAYRAGRAALDTIPRWAAPGLAPATAADGARALFGPAATRSVRAAFERRLAWEGDGPPPLLAVAAAVLGGPALEADDIAALLAIDEPPTDPDRWPGPDEIARFHRVAPRLGRERVRRLLADAIGPRDGLARLVAALQLLDSTEDRLPGRVPLGLTPTIVELEGWLSVGTGTVDMHTDTSVGVPPAPAPRSANRPQGPGRRTRPAPASWRGLAPAEGAIDARLRLVVPDEPGRLVSWGQQLRNCLATFVPPVTNGTTAIGAVEANGRLRYVLEVTPAGVLRQLFAKANTPVPPADATRIVRHLADKGVIDLAKAGNAHWRWADRQPARR